MGKHIRNWNQEREGNASHKTNNQTQKHQHRGKIRQIFVFYSTHLPLAPSAERGENGKSKNSVIPHVTYHPEEHLETKWSVLELHQLMEVVLRRRSCADKRKQQKTNFILYRLVKISHLFLYSQLENRLRAFCIVRWVTAVAPCSLIERHQRLNGTCWLHSQGPTVLTLGAVESSSTLM